MPSLTLSKPIKVLRRSSAGGSIPCLGFALRGRLQALALVLAAVAARLHLVPAARPHFAPGEGPLAHNALLDGQVLLYMHVVCGQYFLSPVTGLRRFVCAAHCLMSGAQPCATDWFRPQGYLAMAQVIATHGLQLPTTCV